MSLHTPSCILSLGAYRDPVGMQRHPLHSMQPAPPHKLQLISSIVLFCIKMLSCGVLLSCSVWLSCSALLSCVVLLSGDVLLSCGVLLPCNVLPCTYELWVRPASDISTTLICTCHCHLYLLHSMLQAETKIRCLPVCHDGMSCLTHWQ